MYILNAVYMEYALTIIHHNSGLYSHITPIYLWVEVSKNPGFIPILLRGI